MAMVVVSGQGFFVIISSHIAHVSSTLTIITLDGGTTFSNAYIGKVWRPYVRLKPSIEVALNRLRTALDLVTKHREALTRFRGEIDSERRKGMLSLPSSNDSQNKYFS